MHDPYHPDLTVDRSKLQMGRPGRRALTAMIADAAQEVKRMCPRSSQTFRAARVPQPLLLPLQQKRVCRLERHSAPALVRSHLQSMAAFIAPCTAVLLHVLLLLQWRKQMRSGHGDVYDAFRATSIAPALVATAGYLAALKLSQRVMANCAAYDCSACMLVYNAYQVRCLPACVSAPRPAAPCSHLLAHHAF